MNSTAYGARKAKHLTGRFDVKTLRSVSLDYPICVTTHTHIRYRLLIAHAVPHVIVLNCTILGRITVDETHDTDVRAITKHHPIRTMSADS